MEENPFNDFLVFEKKVFGDAYPVAHYDPYLIRYGEYRFVLDQLGCQPGETILDLGCESNIFILYLTSLGMRAVGIDLNPGVWKSLKARKEKVEQATRQNLNLTFMAQDATRLSLEPASIDKAIAISSVEHMFSDHGHGDQLAIASLAHVLKPGGLVVITLPMSNGGPFHETAVGDKQFNGPYRLYTPGALYERILSHPQMETVRLSYLAQTTPDVRYTHLHFFRFWMKALSSQERDKWAWATPILSSIFNPIISEKEGNSRLDTVNTALVCLRKRV